MTTTDRQANINIQFAAISKGRTTADLTGSEKQIAWANDIRARLVVSHHISYGPMVGYYADGGTYTDPGQVSIDEYSAATGMLLRIRDASWWINNRYALECEMHAIAMTLVAKHGKK